ncbi:hypothetical protein [Meiothermus sp.]|uniref:hypothetical protein n=1 Tax=Meiothermus sp. TaxID=1955249 RepID=UPI0021DEAE81|nr:hypothetical protein [Meiothermus sp.]GIW32818.1 MAG: hypothetical protein KatS3mg072_0151 [Meiothermus sp.]
MEAKPPQPLDLVLHLEPATPQQPWRAVLLDPETGKRHEFESPLLLLQYLEQLCRNSGGRVFGIR